MKEEKLTAKEQLLKKVLMSSKDKFTLFESNSPNSDKDMLLLPLGNYQAAMDLILYLLKTCIMALQADYSPDKYIGEPEFNISEVLKLITQIIPYEEMEFLDEMQAILKQEH